MTDADIICNRIEVGAEKPGDWFLLDMLKIKGVNPEYYVFDASKFTLERRGRNDLNKADSSCDCDYHRPVEGVPW